LDIDIKIEYVSESTKGKINFCFFCDSGFTNLRKHHLRKHRQEEDVASIENAVLGSKERKTLLANLQKKGNFKHNIKVLKEKKRYSYCMQKAGL